MGTEVGDLALDQPRDRNGSFASALVPKGARRLGGLEDMIISLYAGGMTIRDIEHHLAATLGTELSHETISKVTDAVVEEVTAWQTRPLEAFYPVIYLDALVVKIRDGAHVTNRAAHIAVGRRHGRRQARPGDLGAGQRGREVLGRGVRRAGQPRRPRRPDRVLRRADRVPRGDRGDLAAGDGPDLRGAPDPGLDAVRVLRRPQGRRRRAAPDLHRAERGRRPGRAGRRSPTRSWGRKYPAAVATWENAWERFTPFLAFGPALRKVIYTTNSIESLNYQLRKIIKNRGHFPNDAAAVKLLWLAIRNIEDKRARERAKEAGRPAQPRKAPGQLVEGQIVTNWKQALAELAIVYPDRINPHL